MFAFDLLKKISSAHVSVWENATVLRGIADRLSMVLTRIISEATKQERIKALCAEKAFLQRANLWYWKQEDPTPHDRAEYKRRRDQLDKIRHELFRTDL